jgi:hypothetical protein
MFESERSRLTGDHAFIVYRIDFRRYQVVAWVFAILRSRSREAPRRNQATIKLV